MTTKNDETCPKCGGVLDYDEVDIGVGVQKGNFGCPNCGWRPAPPDPKTEPELDDDIPW